MSDTPTDKPKSDLAARKVGALWIRQSNSGNRYLSGDIEITRDGKIEKLFIQVMKNVSQFKVDGDRKPDYEVFLAPPREKVKDDILDKT